LYLLKKHDVSIVINHTTEIKRLTHMAKV
jgi:hypothetical protein